MKQLYTILFVLIMAFPAIAQQDYYVNNPGGLNLRKGPGTKHEVIISMPKGSKVTVVKKESDEWWKVRYENREGYVSSQFLGQVEPVSHTNQNNNPGSQSQKSPQTNTNDSKIKDNNTNHSAGTGGKSYRYGIGLRFGDPAGITGIKYLNNNKAFELNIGRTAMWGYDFNKRFKRYDNFNNYVYQNGKFRSALGIQLHYLTYKRIDGGLQWYYGIGGQINVISADYYYRYKINTTPDIWAYRWEKATDINFGFDGTLGLNYNFRNAPLSIFSDLTLFAEIYDNPFFLWFKGGMGIRFNF
jgi:uncharacterized protein YraI